MKSALRGEKSARCDANPRSAIRRVLIALVCAAAFGACDRIVDLTPADARGPDGATSGSNDAAGGGDAGRDGGINDDGGGIGDAFTGDAGAPDA
jgi:hypothetical protein